MLPLFLRLFSGVNESFRWEQVKRKFLNALALDAVCGISNENALYD